MTLTELKAEFKKIPTKQRTPKEFGRMLREYAKATYKLVPQSQFVEVYDSNTPLYKKLIHTEVANS